MYSIPTSLSNVTCKGSLFEWGEFSFLTKWCFKSRSQLSFLCVWQWLSVPGIPRLKPHPGQVVWPLLQLKTFQAGLQGLGLPFIRHMWCWSGPQWVSVIIEIKFGSVSHTCSSTMFDLRAKLLLHSSWCEDRGVPHMQKRHWLDSSVLPFSYFHAHTQSIHCLLTITSDVSQTW